MVMFGSLPIGVLSSGLSRQAATIVTLLFVTIASCLPQSAQATIVTITIAGNVSFGTDQTGVFGGPPNSSLVGKTFSLVYVFDDTRASTQFSYSNGVPYASAIQTVDTANVLSNPGTSTLTISGKSYSLGTSPAVYLQSSAQRIIQPGQDTVQFLVNETYSYTGAAVNGGAGVQMGISTYTPSHMFSDPDWRKPFSYTLLAGDWQNGSFSINRYGPSIPTSAASGTLVPYSITVAQGTPTSGDVPLPGWALALLGTGLLGAIRLKNRRSTY
jgi:hypothetical protein